MKLLARVASFYILFGILPILAGATLLKHAIDTVETADRVAAVESLKDELSDLRDSLDPKSFHSRWFGALSSADVTGRLNLSGTRKRIERWGGQVDLFRFAPDSTLATMTWHHPQAQYAARILWRELRSRTKKPPERTRADEASIDLAFGTDFDVRILRTSGSRGMVVRAGKSDNLLFWKGFGDGGGIIGCVWQVPSGDQLLRCLSKLRLRTGVALLASWPGGPWRRFGRDCPPGAADRAAERFRLYKESWLESDGFIWVSDGMGEATLMACRQNPAVAAARLRLAVNGLALLLAGGAFVFWYRWLIAGADIWVSVRVKLILLFFFSTLLPLAGLAGLASEAVSEREKVLAERAVNEGKRLLEAVDAGYEADRRRIRSVFRRLRDDPVLRSSDPGVRQARVKALQKRYGMVKIELRDRRGGLVVSTDKPEMLARVENIFRIMTQIGLERHAPELIPPDVSASVRQVDLFTRMAFESPVLGLSTAMDMPDTVLNLDFSMLRGLWYWDVIRDASHPAAFINIVKNRHEAVDYYLKQHFSARKQATDGFRIFAYDVDGDVLTGREGTPIPPPLQKVFNRSRISGTAVAETVSFRRTDHLVVAMPSVFLGRRQLLASIPKTLALSTLDGFKTAVWLMFMIIALAAVIAGKILADLFLKPIAELAAGMTALQQGNTSVRVRVESDDELGELGSAFNRMLEDMEEVRMAKMVQDSLIPAGALAIPGFDASVTLRRVSELSGDYVDAMELPDGRWLLVTGDVSGHGTSAALTMAMAKSITVQCAEESGDPVALLAQIDRTLFQLLGRRQVMFFSAVCLDPLTGSVECSAGGAPHPFIIRRSGAIETIGMDHLPLASSPHPAPFPSRSAILGPGDILMLYTDGLMKNGNAARTSFGDQRLVEAVRSAPVSDAATFSGRIMAVYDGFVGQAPPDDDLSMLVLRRHPENPASDGVA